MAKHGKAWQRMAGGCKGEKFSFDHRQTDGQTEGQVQVLSCAFAAKKIGFKFLKIFPTFKKYFILDKNV